VAREEPHEVLVAPVLIVIAILIVVRGISHSPIYSRPRRDCPSFLRLSLRAGLGQSSRIWKKNQAGRPTGRWRHGRGEETGGDREGAQGLGEFIVDASQLRRFWVVSQARASQRDTVKPHPLKLVPGAKSARLPQSTTIACWGMSSIADSPGWRLVRLASNPLSGSEPCSGEGDIGNQQQQVADR
jgi:hypothetical protein